MNKLDVLLVFNEITYDQWVDSDSIYEDLGWSDGDICMEIDARWSPTYGLIERANNVC
jgi:hypothetical protein